MIEEIYDIEGMHCAVCASTVERVTKKLEGVSMSEVNLPLNQLRISYDESICSSQDIISKIEKAGFHAKEHAERKYSSALAKTPDKVFITDKIQLVISILLSCLIAFISMRQMLVDSNIHPIEWALVQLFLTIPVLIIGRHYFINGITTLLHGNPTMDTLVAISAGTSFIYSVIMTFLIKDNVYNSHQLYFESCAMVITFVSVGKYLEEMNKEKTKGAINGLIELAPSSCILVDTNGQWEVPIDRIKVGDTVLVKAGMQIPVDGIVIKGKGSINEAMLTGESLPVDKVEGNEVIGGSICSNGLLYIRATRIGRETTLSKIIKFVEEAQGRKAPISRIADRVSSIFVPIVVIIACIATFIWIALGKEVAFALKIFTSVLVIACPCAMGLATPTAIIVGTGLGVAKGILIRSGEILELTHKVKVAIFDKTGTLTEGKPFVVDVIGDKESHLLEVAFSLEQFSNHPISTAICDYAQCHKISSYPVKEFQNMVGLGLTAQSEADKVLCVGNKALMEAHHISIKEYLNDLEQFKAEGKTVLFVAEDDKVIGIITVADKLKSDASECIDTLKKMGIKTVLLTGDTKETAEYIAKEVHIDEVISEVLPTQKAEVIKKYQSAGDTVMMIGDGINDAPSLIQADIGVAIGTGSDIAIDAGDIILMKPYLSHIPKVIHLSQLTLRTIKQNLFWAFCYNILSIPIACGLLYPVFNILLSPMIAALAMSLSSLFVVSNALRLKHQII